MGLGLVLEGPIPVDSPTQKPLGKAECEVGNVDLAGCNEVVRV